MRDAIAIIAVLALLPMLLLLVRFAAKRWNLPAEVRRKSVHIGMGLATLPFPWLFSSWIPVAILSGLSLVLLTIWKLFDKHTLHGVERKSEGDFWFPVAVVLVFWMADNGQTPVLYLVPMLVLTLADACGALVGVSYGKTEIKVLSGHKSIEGSALVFLVSFLSVHVPVLLMTETGRAESLLIGVVLALVVMLIEGVSVRGLDNILMPVVAAWLLSRYLDLSVADLAARIGVIAALTAVILWGKRYSSLECGALLAAILFGYAFWALGGWQFLLLPVILFAEHLWVTRRLKKTFEVVHDLCAVLSVGLSLLVFLAIKVFAEIDTFPAFAAATAMHLGILNLTTRTMLARNVKGGRLILLSLAKTTLLILFIAFLIHQSWLALAVSTILTGAGLATFRAILGNPEKYPIDGKRWTIQGVLACAVGLIVLLLSLSSVGES